jgi:hypothetical protein
MLLHTSPSPTLAQDWDSGRGRFGSALFFVNGYDKGDAYVMTAGAYTVYAISDEDEDELKIATRWDLDTDDLGADYDVEDDESGDWAEQVDLLARAIAAGYDGVEDEDEQGSVTILNGDVVINMMIKL